MIDQFLLKNGFLPYRNHNNALYRSIEEESRSLAKAILGEECLIYVVKSTRVNAYRTTFEGTTLLILTDALLLKLQKTVQVILNHDNIIYFFRNSIGYEYLTCDTGIPFWHGSNPVDQFLENKFYPYMSLLAGLVKGSAVYITMHEIGHGLSEYEYVNVNLPFNIKTTYGDVVREYSADMYASEFILERFHTLISMSESRKQIHNITFNFIQSFLSGLVAITISTEKNKDHPEKDARYELIHGAYQNFLLLSNPLDLDSEDMGIIMNVFTFFGRVVLPILHELGESNIGE